MGSRLNFAVSLIKHTVCMCFSLSFFPVLLLVAASASLLAKYHSEHDHHGSSNERVHRDEINAIDDDFSGPTNITVRNVPLISDDILSRGEPSAVPQSRERRGGPPACHSGGEGGGGPPERQGGLKGAPRRGHNPTKLRMEFTQNIPYL